MYVNVDFTLIQSHQTPPVNVYQNTSPISFSKFDSCKILKDELRIESMSNCTDIKPYMVRNNTASLSACTSVCLSCNVTSHSLSPLYLLDDTYSPEQRCTGESLYTERFGSWIEPGLSHASSNCRVSLQVSASELRWRKS